MIHFYPQKPCHSLVARHNIKTASSIPAYRTRSTFLDIDNIFAHIKTRKVIRIIFERELEIYFLYLYIILFSSRYITFFAIHSTRLFYACKISFLLLLVLFFCIIEFKNVIFPLFITSKTLLRSVKC